MIARALLAWFFCMCLAACSRGRDEATAGEMPDSAGRTHSAADRSAYDSLFAVIEGIYFAGGYDSAAAMSQQVRELALQGGEVAVEARALT